MRRILTLLSLLVLGAPAWGQKKKDNPELATKTQREEVVKFLRERIDAAQQKKWSNEERQEILEFAQKNPGSFLPPLFDDWSGHQFNFGYLTNRLDSWETQQVKGKTWEVHPRGIGERPHWAEKQIEIPVRPAGTGPVVNWKVEKIVDDNTVVLSREVDLRINAPIVGPKLGQGFPSMPDRKREKFYTIDLPTKDMKLDNAPNLTPFRERIFIVTCNKTIDGKDTQRVLPFDFTDAETKQLSPTFSAKPKKK